MLFFLGHVVLTWAELFLSASGWTLEAELMDPRRRGDYQGVCGAGRHPRARFWAPAVYGFLAMQWGAFGWLTIAAIVTAGAVGLHVAAHAARRFLEQHVPADVLADARAGAPEPQQAPAPGPPSMPGPDAPLPESSGDLLR